MKIIITGAYSIGTYLAKLFAKNKDNIIIIDSDQERLEKINNEADLLTVCASTTNINTLKSNGIDEADLYIAVTPDQSVNINNCIIAHALNAKKTVAKVDDPEFMTDDSREFFRRLGVDNLIYPEELAAREIISGLKMSWVRQRWDVHGGALVMLGIKLHHNCEILDQPLKDICGPDDPYHIVAIKRDADTIIPNGNDTLKYHDLAYFMTTKQYIPYIRRIVGKEHYVDVKNVMMMGCGNTGERAVKMMPSYMNVKIFESDPHRVEVLNEVLPEKALVISADGRDVEELKNENIRDMQAFVALTNNTEVNILSCLTAKQLGVRKTVAMIDNMAYVGMAEQLSIGTIINKKAIAASAIYQIMLDTNVMNITYLLSANADAAEFVPVEGSKITQHPVKNLKLPKGMTIGGLVREGKGMLVSGNTEIKPGDSVVVFCHGINLKQVEKLFN
ncbi:MAG: Trk system potassium transporter TrkA [Prevotella sp.]|jgi:trk system potassium uptake protein TrkA|nr:Trk system potassium transporter TrkA [Prevotella sp.]